MYRCPLQNLRRLDLDFNQLSVLPAGIAQLQYLRDLGLKDNPLKTPPYEIARDGMGAIRAYFNVLGDAPQSVNELKVVLVGEGASGKTSLVKRLFNEAFNQHEAQTHGINIRDWTFPTDSGRNIKARLWDFGGQQIMHATHEYILFLSVLGLTKFWKVSRIFLIISLSVSLVVSESVDIVVIHLGGDSLVLSVNSHIENCCLSGKQKEALLSYYGKVWLLVNSGGR
ncbi:MAG: ADP-ribosylation factor-like protein [Thiotrichaceae bacterium]